MMTAGKKTMAKEYVERDMVISHKWKVRSYDPSDPDPVTEVVSVSSIMQIPAADVVSGRDFRDCRNELCLQCGQYKTKHLGSCEGCRWDH